MKVLELNQVEVVHSKKLEWKDTPIIPIGDLQIQPNRELFDEKRFRQVIKWGMENDAYYVGMGDYSDFGSPSNRARLKSAMADGGLYDSTIDALDAAAAEHLGWLMEMLEPTKGRWLGLLEGHHLWEFQDGTTTDTRLANFLGCRFLGTAAYVNVSFPVAPSMKKQPPSFNIWCVDTETEALSRSGWKRHDQVLIGEEILAYDPDTGKVSWKVVEDKFVGPYAGPVHEFKSRGKTIAVTTPDHRWYSAKNGGKFQDMTSEQITDDARWTIPNLGGPVEFGDETVEDSFASLVAWVVTEGTMRKRHVNAWEVIIYQSEGDTADRIRGLLTQCGMPAEAREYRPSHLAFSLSGDHARRIVACLNEDKTPTREFAESLSPRQRVLFFEEMMLGDGDDVRLIQSQRTGLLDQVQGMLATCGVSSSVVWKDRRGPIVVNGRHGKRNDISGRLKVSHKLMRKITRSTVRDFSGTVWCPTVETGFWVARREGVTYVTGNCHHGRAGGKLLATPLNQLEQVVKGFDADVYLVGHHHKAVAGRMARIYPKFSRTGKHTLEHRDVYVACTGSFLKGWLEGQTRGGKPSATYAEKGMMNPLALGHIVVWARPRWNEDGTPRVDISVTV